jgi:hypothetical protein
VGARIRDANNQFTLSAPSAQQKPVLVNYVRDMHRPGA